jgi:hypothetical protein
MNIVRVQRADEPSQCLEYIHIIYLPQYLRFAEKPQGVDRRLGAWLNFKKDVLTC